MLCSDRHQGRVNILFGWCCHLNHMTLRLQRRSAYCGVGFVFEIIAVEDYKIKFAYTDMNLV